MNRNRVLLNAETPEEELIIAKAPAAEEVSAAEEAPADEEAPAAEEVPVAEEAPAEEETPAVGEEAVMPESSEMAEPLPDETESGEEDLVKKIRERKPYKDRYYLLYGNKENPPETLDLEGTLKFLQELGFDRNPLRQAREGKDLAEKIGSGMVEGSGKVCSFCGRSMTGTEYSVLRDGRIRCGACSRTIIKNAEDFERLFRSVKENMERFFGIRIMNGLSLQMVNAKKLHKGTGNNFIPNGKGDPRILGYAMQDKKGNMSLVIENGSPRMSAVQTMVHEMTHIWQYQNWNAEKIIAAYGPNQRLQIYEGMAKWVEIQYCFLIGEAEFGKLDELETTLRDDEYGQGFAKYCSVYPISYGMILETDTPFANKDRPL